MEENESMRERTTVAAFFRRPDSRGKVLMMCDNRAAYFVRVLIVLVLNSSILVTTSHSLAQSVGGHTLFGDLTVDKSGADEVKPISYSIILYAENGRVVGRQSVTANGRFRFNDLHDGDYNLVVELENNEVARIRVKVAAPMRTDFRQDIAMEWRSNTAGNNTKGAAVVSIGDGYERTAANRTLLNKAGEAAQKGDYAEAVSLLDQIVKADGKDFEAWTELGTALLSQKDHHEAEQAYLKALKMRPTYVMALVNLGRLRVMKKNYEAAIDPLSLAVKVRPESATANYYLGEAYLQIKKGSQAVIYFNEALRLDPIGKAEAHLRLAALYNAAGLKDRAANEYEQYLKKKPDHPLKSKLQKYIQENKKP